MTRPSLDLVIALLTATLLCGPSPAGADVAFVKRDAEVADFGQRVRPKDRPGTPARPQRSGEGGHFPPVDRGCTGANPPGTEAQDQGDGPEGAACGELSVELLNPAPEGFELQVEKSSLTTEITGPGPVNYRYSLVNTGIMPITGIVVMDDHVDAPPICPVNNLPPMASTVCDATYSVTLADIEAGGSPVPESGFLQNNVTVITAEGASATAALFIPYAVAPDPLVLLPASPSLGTVLQGTTQEFIFTAQGGVPPRQFSGIGAPAGMSFVQGPAGLFLTGSPQETGNFIITVNVTDSASPPSSVSRNYSLMVLSSLALSPSGQPLPDAVAGRPYEFAFTISGGTPPYEFAVDGVPRGLEFELDGNQLLLGGAGSETGEFTIVLTVSDSSSPPQLVSETYALRVAPELRLLPEDPELPEAEAGESYELAFATEGGLEPVQLSGEGAPPGMQFQILSGQLILSGIPSELGDYQIVVSAQDATSPPQLIVREYLLSVVLTLELEPESLPRATTGQDYLSVLSVRNGIPPFLIEVHDLPPGLSMNSNAITGRPNQTGTFSLTALASDAVGNTGMRDYVLEVGTNNDVEIGETLPDAYLNTAYGYQLKVVGAPSPVIWSGGNGLPPGMELVSTGLVNGLAQETGSFSFSATANSADGQTRTGDFDIDVLPPALVSAEPIFPPGLIGVPYHSPTAVRGGMPPFDCGIIGGSLPPGLAVMGCNAGIQGTPSAAGSFPFTLGVLDSSVPELAAELDGIIQVAESTPIGDQLPPDLDYRPPLKVPTPELALERPDEASPDESLQHLAVDRWGNRYLIGFSFNGSDYDIRVLKFSPQGVLLWDQLYDSGSHDYGYGVTVAVSDQAVYASGYSLVGNRYEAVLIRYDLVGAQQWVVQNGGDSQVVALYGLAAGTSGVYAVGERYNGSNFDALAVHYSHAGNLLWETVRPSQQTRTGYAAVLTDCDAAPCLLISGAEGETIRSGWIERIEPATGAASPVAVVSAAPVLALQASDAGIFAGGSTDNNDWFIIALNRDGQVDWSITEPSGHRLRGLALHRNGFLYAAGSGNSAADGMVALILPTGDTAGITHFDDGAVESFHAIGIGPEGLVTAAGQRDAVDGNRFLLVNFNTGKAQ